MKGWSYYALHTFINSIKKIFRTKFLVFILICAMCGIIFGFGIGLAIDSFDTDSYSDVDASDIKADCEYILLSDEENLYHGDNIYISAGDKDVYVNSDYEGYTIVELEDYLDRDKNHIQSREEIAEYIYSGQELLPENFTVASFGIDDISAEEFMGITLNDETIYIFVEAAAELIFIIFILFSVYFGSKKGCDIFLMPDVNFLFAAPMKGQSVLLFRLSFQLVGTLIGCAYLLFQIPNLLNAGLSMVSILLGLGGFLMMLLMQKVVNVLSYIVCANNDWLKKHLQQIVIGIGAAVVLVSFLTFKKTGEDLLGTISLLYGPNATRYIPIFGWFKAMVATGMAGNYLSCFLYFLLFTASIVVVFILTWRIKADFYEEALLGAQTRDEISQAAQEKANSLKREKDRSDKIKRNTGMKGQGASMFFHKEFYNRKRMAHFGVFTNTMLTYLAFTIVPLLIMIFGTKSTNFYVITVLLAIVLFFRSMGNPIAMEVENVWLVLAPYSALSKLSYSMLAGTVACALDLLPSIAIAAIVCKISIPVALLWYLTLILLDYAIAIIGVMLDALIPTDGLDNIKVGITMMLRFIIAGIFFAIVGICGAFLGVCIGLILSMVFLIVVSCIGSFVYPLSMDIGK